MEDIIGCEDGIIPENTYLVLGDNRTDSMDSRDIGVIKKEDIMGKTTLKIWPFTNFGFIK
jgi:signal peptidase I